MDKKQDSNAAATPAESIEPSAQDRHHIMHSGKGAKKQRINGEE